jgi:hypothetical protein
MTLALLATASAAQATVWFTDIDQNTIGRANATGQVVDSVAVVTDQDRTLSGLALDGRYIYWSNANTDDPSAATSSIGRAELDAAGDVIPASVDQDFITDLRRPLGLAVDPRPTKTFLYWADAKTPYAAGQDPPAGLDQIGRVEIDPEGNIVAGTRDEDFITGASSPQDVEAVGDDIYWTNRSNDSIGHARLSDVGNIVGIPTNAAVVSGDTLPNDPTSQPNALEPFGIVARNGFVYWTNRLHKNANPTFNPAQAVGPFNQPVLYGDGKTINRVPVGVNGLPSAAVQRGFVGSQPRPTGQGTGAQAPTGLATDGNLLYWNNFGVPFFNAQDNDIGRTRISSPNAGFLYSFVQTGMSTALVALRDSTVALDCPTSQESRVTCTATVTDPESDNAESPQGVLTFGASGAGTWDPADSECILSEASDSTSTCVIDFIREGNNGQAITVSYAGSPIHAGTTGDGTLLPRIVITPPDPPIIPPKGDRPPRNEPGPGGGTPAVNLKKCKKKKSKKARKKCKKKAKAKAKAKAAA